jgi:ATP-dependent DNA helicase RecG
MTLTTPLDQISQIGKRTYASLKKLGLFCVRDLLCHFPSRYDDFSRLTPIISVAPEASATVRGTITNVQARRTWKRRMTLVEATIEDQSGTIAAIWFNQPYLVKVLRPGYEYYFSGKAGFSPEGVLQFQNPVFERFDEAGETVHTGRIVPVYPLSGNLTGKQLRYLVSLAVAQARFEKDWLPYEIKQSEKLVSLSQALSWIHFPPSQELLAQAQRRLKFDELFFIQLQAKKIKATIKTLKAPPIPFFEQVTKEFVQSLPFALTADQKKVAWAILGDLKRSYPMNRLLEGEVGSGKTVVSALVFLNVIQAGFQGALLAPTEILARQHYENLTKLFRGFKVRVGLLTASEQKISKGFDPLRVEPSKKVDVSKGFDPQRVEPSKKPFKKGDISHAEMLRIIDAGEIDLVIGTHALLSESVSFGKLGLVVIDEQHRFGVSQRAALRRKNTEVVPHLLTMTATPIPRTLSLALYGDLDISIIKQLPPGRQKIETKLIEPRTRESAYAFIKQEIKKGRQAFVICPRIEEKVADCAESPPYPPLERGGVEKISFVRGGAQQGEARQLSMESPRPDRASGLAMTLKQEVKAAKAEYKKLSEEIFPDLKIGLLHGKLASKTRAKVMEDFLTKKYDILVATSMVEVGVDVQNATVMMIEGAESFGLAQLHQLRGRVGRSSFASYCFLFPGTISDEARLRLSAFEKSNDGFALAEQDLKLRGPGARWGIEQSGFKDFKIATLFDFELIEKAKQWADKLIAADILLRKYPLLRDKLTSRLKEAHLE